MTELTLPCAFVRKRGLPDSRFLCITRRLLHSYSAHGDTRTHTCASPSVLHLCTAHTVRRRFSTLVAASWTFPFNFRDTALEGSYTRPSVPVLFSSFFLFSPLSTLDCYISNRIRKLRNERQSLSATKERISEILRAFNGPPRDSISVFSINAMVTISLKCHMNHSCRLSRML